MAALTADRETDQKDGILMAYPVKAATKIFKGSLVMLLPAAGYAVPAANTATGIVIGVAYETIDNTLGADGAVNIRVYRKGIFKFAASSIAITSVGAVMYVVDDQTIDETDPSNSVTAGKLVLFESATVGWIDLGL